MSETENKAGPGQDGTVPGTLQESFEETSGRSPREKGGEKPGPRFTFQRTPSLTEVVEAQGEAIEELRRQVRALQEALEEKEPKHAPSPPGRLVL